MREDVEVSEAGDSDSFDVEAVAAVVDIVRKAPAIAFVVSSLVMAAKHLPPLVAKWKARKAS